MKNKILVYCLFILMLGFVFVILGSSAGAVSYSYYGGTTDLIWITGDHGEEISFDDIYQQDVSNSWNQITKIDDDIYLFNCTIYIQSKVDLVDTNKVIIFDSDIAGIYKSILSGTSSEIKFGLDNNGSGSDGCVIIDNRNNYSSSSPGGTVYNQRGTIGVGDALWLYDSYIRNMKSCHFDNGLDSIQYGGINSYSADNNSVIMDSSISGLSLLFGSRSDTVINRYMVNGFGVGSLLSVNSNESNRVTLINGTYGISDSKGNFSDIYVHTFNKGTGTNTGIDMVLADTKFFNPVGFDPISVYASAYDSSVNLINGNVFDAYSHYSDAWVNISFTNDLQVIDIDGNPISGATVKFYNVTDVLIENKTTGSNGFIETVELLYKSNCNGVDTVYSPYTVNITDGSNSTEFSFNSSRYMNWTVLLKNCSGVVGGSGWISPYPFNFSLSDDNISCNVSVTANNTGTLLNSSVNESGWLNIASFSLSTELTFVLFIGLFFWFASERKSAFLFMLCGIVSFVTGIYYIVLETSVSYTIIAVSIIGFSFYSMFLALVHYKNP